MNAADQPEQEACVVAQTPPVTVATTPCRGSGVTGVNASVMISLRGLEIASSLAEDCCHGASVFSGVRLDLTGVGVGAGLIREPLELPSRDGRG